MSYVVYQSFSGHPSSPKCRYLAGPSRQEHVISGNVGITPTFIHCARQDSLSWFDIEDPHSHKATTTESGVLFKSKHCQPLVLHHGLVQYCDSPSKSEMELPQSSTERSPWPSYHQSTTGRKCWYTISVHSAWSCNPTTPNILNARFRVLIPCNSFNLVMWTLHFHHL